MMVRARAEFVNSAAEHGCNLQTFNSVYTSCCVFTTGREISGHQVTIGDHTF
jgi:hypothetical protein